MRPLLAAVAVAFAALALVSVAQAQPLPLGPTIIKTDAPPTGYVVTIRHKAPEGVTAVQVYADWWFANPKDVTSINDPIPIHPSSEWQPGDFETNVRHIQPMVLGADGVWEITVPLPNDTLRYAFTYDCTSETGAGCTLNPDPANPWPIVVQYSAPVSTVGATRSTIYVPSNPLFPTYDNGYEAPISAEKSGTLASVEYDAPESTNPVGKHWMVVYTPAGYNPNRSTPYPLLILSHGAGDASPAWFVQGVAHYILENAIQEGVVQPMVIVSTDFNFLPGGSQGYADHLRNRVIPYLEANYNVSTRSEDRAFGGFSAGGSRAFTIMNSNTDLFGYHAAWSIGGSTPSDTVIERLKTIPGGIFFGSGYQDQTARNSATTLHNLAVTLRDAGVERVFEDYMDGMHTWNVWRPLMNYYIRNVAFRTTTTSLTVEPPIQAGKSHNSRVTAIATVGTVTASATPPSGEVAFYAGDTLLGTRGIEYGTAIFRQAVRTELLTKPIVAKYLGDILFNGSESPPVEALQ